MDHILCNTNNHNNGWSGNMEKIDEVTHNQQLIVAPQQIGGGCHLDSDQMVIWQ